MNRMIALVLILAFLIAACSTPSTPQPSAANTVVPVKEYPASLPNFDHIILMLFENTEFDQVNGNPLMPALSAYAHQYTLLTKTYAITHPSLPNYLALTGGDIFGVKKDCIDCFFDAISLADLIEQSGRTWKTYQEDMPAPCFIGNQGKYYQKHNPFLYFDPVRNDKARCEHSIVPLTQLDADIAANNLPNYLFITPNACNNGHDCKKNIVDAWIKGMVTKLQTAFEAHGEPYLIILTWDEGSQSGSCCGLPASAGGNVAVILISPQVKNGFVDDTPYTHYSILKTISAVWHLPYLGHAADEGNVVITAPWK